MELKRKSAVYISATDFPTFQTLVEKHGLHDSKSMGDLVLNCLKKLEENIQTSTNTDGLQLVETLKQTQEEKAKVLEKLNLFQKRNENMSNTLSKLEKDYNELLIQHNGLKNSTKVLPVETKAKKEVKFLNIIG